MTPSFEARSSLAFGQPELGSREPLSRTAEGHARTCSLPACPGCAESGGTPAHRARATFPGEATRYRGGSGAPLVAWVTFPVDRFELVGGSLTEYASSQGVVRGFCTTCGTSLTYAHEARSAEIDVALATLDDPATLEPGFHVWVSHKPPWVRLDDDLPQHPEWRTSAD